MRSKKNDLEYLIAASIELQQYIFSPHLFWTLSGPKGAALQGDTDRLTPGNILLTMRRLEGAEFSEADEKAYQIALAAIQQTIAQWRSNWAKKAVQEFSKRLDLWSDYLHSLYKSPEDHRGDYAYHIRDRVILVLLLTEIEPPEAATLQYVATMDARLNGILRPDGFVWEDAIARNFPEEQFPYLYATPKME
jgi:hypothetical protein